MSIARQCVRASGMAGRAFALAVLFGLSACAHEPTDREATDGQEPASQRGEVGFEELAPGVWMHSSNKDMGKWGMVVTHGLIVTRGDHSVLIDTAWDDGQTADVLDWAAEELGKPVATAVFTHAHEDKMGGVGAVRARGVRTLAHALSNQLAPQRGLEPAAEDLDLLAPGDSVVIDGVEILYPGGGHTHDNITAYDPESRILFGGCLIRPGPSDNLGNTEDADMDHWAEAASLLEARYPRVQIVVPSHGDPGGADLLDHTRELASGAP